MEGHYPYLERFFLVHFNQDWVFEYENETEAVSDFIEITDFDERVKTCNELVALLNDTTDEELKDLVSRLGCAYYPEPQQTMRAHLDKESYLQRGE